MVLEANRKEIVRQGEGLRFVDLKLRWRLNKPTVTLASQTR